MNFNNNDTAILAQASLFRKIRAISRTMRKTEWRLTGKVSCAIRTNDRASNDCPLSFVGKTGTASQWELAGLRLGLSVEQSTNIIRAADSNNPRPPSIRKLRRILLKSAGLQ